MDIWKSKNIYQKNLKGRTQVTNIAIDEGMILKRMLEE
jgi:hypothetical protein